MRFALTLFVLILALPAAAMEVRIHPGMHGIYLYEIEPRRGLSTALIQNLAIVQPEGSPIPLTEVSIELRSGDRVRQTLRYDQTDLAAAAARMSAIEKAGLLDLYDFAFQRSRYLGEKISLATSATVEPNSALVMTSIPLLLPRGIDGIRIVAKGTDSAGKPVEATLLVPAKRYAQINDYSIPIRGASVVAVGPGLSEPHRWAMNEEFALDIVRLGSSGKTCRGDCRKLADYYIWGSDVLAAADGVVVSTITDQKESTTRFRRADESAEAFMQRTQDEQMKLVSSGVPGIAGNLVVIRHEGGEFSHYAHLAEGSVAVKPGDEVKRGQRIAKAGQTGNSTEPHLHFGIADSSDPLYGRSLPVRFSGVTTVDGPQPPVYVQSGWIIDAD